MKILSKAPLAFNLADGTIITPGARNYKRIELTPAVKYQLAILKCDGLVDYRENLPQPGIDMLPIMEEVELEDEEIPADVKPVRRRKKAAKRA